MTDLSEHGAHICDLHFQDEHSLSPPPMFQPPPDHSAVPLHDLHQQGDYSLSPLPGPVLQPPPGQGAVHVLGLHHQQGDLSRFPLPETTPSSPFSPTPPTYPPSFPTLTSCLGFWAFDHLISVK